MHLAPSTAWAWLIACAVVILLFPLAAQFGNFKGKLSSFRTWAWAVTGYKQRPRQRWMHRRGLWELPRW